VGVATFDSVIHFYGLSGSRSQPQMLVVSDVGSPYCPVAGALVVDIIESRPLVRARMHGQCSADIGARFRPLLQSLRGFWFFGVVSPARGSPVWFLFLSKAIETGFSCCPALRTSRLASEKHEHANEQRTWFACSSFLVLDVVWRLGGHT
jgi:Sec23/Sec24 trunk domain